MGVVSLSFVSDLRLERKGVGGVFDVLDSDSSSDAGEVERERDREFLLLRMLLESFDLFSFNKSSVSAVSLDLLPENVE